MNITIIKKLSYVLNSNQKAKIFGLSILILIGGLLETLGVSMILPVITVILDVERMEKNHWVQLILKGLHLKDMNQFIVLLLIAVILVFVIKNVYLLIVITSYSIHYTKLYD